MPEAATRPAPQAQPGSQLATSRPAAAQRLVWLTPCADRALCVVFDHLIYSALQPVRKTVYEWSTPASTASSCSSWSAATSCPPRWSVRGSIRSFWVNRVFWLYLFAGRRHADGLLSPGIVVAITDGLILTGLILALTGRGRARIAGAARRGDRAAGRVQQWVRRALGELHDLRPDVHGQRPVSRREREVSLAKGAPRGHRHVRGRARLEARCGLLGMSRLASAG
jgi:hypothetical protein